MGDRQVYRLRGLRRLVQALFLILGVAAALPPAYAMAGVRAPYQIHDGESSAPVLVAYDTPGRVIDDVPGLSWTLESMASKQWQLDETGWKVPWLSLALVGLFILTWWAWPKRWVRCGIHRKTPGRRPEASRRGTARKKRSVRQAEEDETDHFIATLRSSPDPGW